MRILETVRQTCHSLRLFTCLFSRFSLFSPPKLLEYHTVSQVMCSPKYRRTLVYIIVWFFFSDTQWNVHCPHCISSQNLIQAISSCSYFQFLIMFIDVCVWVCVFVCVWIVCVCYHMCDQVRSGLAKFVSHIVQCSGGSEWDLATSVFPYKVILLVLFS